MRINFYKTDFAFRSSILHCCEMGKPWTLCLVTVAIVSMPALGEMETFHLQMTSSAASPTYGIADSHNLLELYFAVNCSSDAMLW